MVVSPVSRAGLALELLRYHIDRYHRSLGHCVRQSPSWADAQRTSKRHRRPCLSRSSNSSLSSRGSGKHKTTMKPPVHHLLVRQLPTGKARARARVRRLPQQRRSERASPMRPGASAAFLLMQRLLPHLPLSRRQLEAKTGRRLRSRAPKEERKRSERMYMDRRGMSRVVCEATMG